MSKHVGACVVVFAIAMVFSARADAAIVNGDFETGDFTGWSTFTTTNGNLGGPAVVSFDTRGNGTSSFSAQFHVGQNSFLPGVEAGGGIFQSFSNVGDALTISADIAAFNSDQASLNDAAGTFTMILDGTPIASFNFGPIDALQTKRTTLFVNEVLVTPGVHELRFLITRPYTSSAVSQYIDNIVVGDLFIDPPAPVPEPGTLAMASVAVMGLVAPMFRRRKN